MSCGFTDDLDELGSDIVGGLDEAGNTIAGTLTGALGAAESFVSSAAGDVFAAVSGVTNALGSIAANTVDDIEKDAASVVEQTISTAEAAYTSATKEFNTIVSAATPLYNKLESETVPFLQQYGQAIVDSEAEDQFTGASLLVNIAWQAISTGQPPTTGQLGQIAAQYAAGAEIPGIANALSQYIPGVSTLLDGGDLDSAVSTFLTTGSLPSNLQGVLSGASQSVVGQIDGIENDISGAVQSALATVVPDLSKGASLVTDAAGRLVGLADTAANIAKLTQAQIVSLAGVGIKTITATADVAIDTAQVLALEASGMKIVAPAVNLADTTADIATYTATQIGALVAAGVTGLQPSDVQASTGVTTIYDAIVSTGQTYSLVPVQALGTLSGFYIVDLTAGQTLVPFTAPTGDAAVRLTATQGGPQGELDLSSIAGVTDLAFGGTGVYTLFGNAANDPLTYGIVSNTTAAAVLQFRDTVGLTANIEQTVPQTGAGTLQELTPNAFGTGSITVGNRVEFSSDSTDGNEILLDGQPTVTLSVDAGLTETLTGSVKTSVEAQFEGPFDQSLLVNGGGTLVLTNASNSWTGGTTVDGTTLQVGGGTAASAGVSVGSGAVTLDNGASLVLDETGDYSFANDVKGDGALVVEGTGTVTLTGANDTTGGIVVNGGTLGVANPSAEGVQAIKLAQGALAFGSTGVYGGQIEIGGPVGSVDTLILANGETVTQTGAVFTVYNGSYQPYGVDVTGSGTLVLTGRENAWTGGTAVTGGATLSIGLASASALTGNSSIGTGGITLGDASSTGTLVTTNTGTITPSDDVSVGAGGGEIDVTSATGSTILGGLSGSGTFTKGGAGTLSLSSDSDTGPLSVVGGTLDLTLASGTVAGGIGLAGTGAGATLLTSNTGAVTIAGGLAVGLGDGTIDVASASGTVTVDGALSGQGTLTKTGAGTLTLAGSGGTSGGITVAAGTLALSGTGGFLNAVTIAGGTLAVASAASVSGEAVTFGTAGGTLEIDGGLGNGATFGAALNGVGLGAVVDFRGLAYTAGSTATVSGGTLTVTSAGTSNAVTLSNPSLTSFSTASDGHGGTLVIDAPATFTDSTGAIHAEASIAAAFAAESADSGTSDQVTLVSGDPGGLQLPGGGFDNTKTVTGGTTSGIASTSGGTVVNTGSVSGTTGISFTGSSANPVSVSGGGTITGTQGAGISAQTGSGPISLGTSGAPLGTVTGTGGDAIDASSASGNVGVVTGGTVTSTTGTGIQASTGAGGNATVTLGAGTSVHGAATPGSHGAGVAVTASGGGSGTIDVTGNGVSVTGDQPAMSSVTTNANAAIVITGTGGSDMGSSGLVADQQGSGAFGASVSVADGTTIGFNGTDPTDSYDGQGIFVGNLGTGTTNITTASGSVTGNANGIVLAQANAADGNAVNVVTGGDVTGDGGTSSVPGGDQALFNGFGQGTTPTGFGVLADNAGLGALNVNTSGGTVQSANANAIEARAAGGKITVTNANAVQHVAGGSGYTGIDAITSGTGGILVTNSGAISGTAGTGAFGNGIYASSTGASGAVTVTTSGGGTIGAGVAITTYGIVGQAFGSGAVSVTADAAVTGTGYGIVAQSSGTGTVTVDGSGAVVGGTGVYAHQHGTATGSNAGVAVQGTGVTTSATGIGIDAAIESANDAGAVNVTRSGAVQAATTGISATTAGAGNVTVTAGSVATTNGSGIVATATSGTIAVTANGSVRAGGTGNAGLFITGSAAGNTAAVTSGQTVQGAIGLRVAGGTTTLTNAGTITTTATNALQIDSGTLQVGDNAFGTVTGNIADAGTLALTNAAALAVANTITGSGIVRQSGVGTTTLTAANGYTGGTVLAGGTLALGSASAIGTAGTVTFGGGALRSTAANTTDYSSRFSTAANQAYRIDTGGQIVTLAGNLTSTGGTFAKLGAGTLDLTGADTYTGATVAAAGTLLVDGSDIASAFEVQNGATLGGHGTLGAVTVDAGGFLSPGDSPGQMTVASLTLSQDSDLIEQLGGTTPGDGDGHYDQTIVRAGGSVNLNGARLDLSNYGGDVPFGGESFDILVNQTGQAVNGTFQGLDEGATTTVGGETFTVTYKGGSTGQDVVLTEVDQAPTASITTLPYSAVEQTSLTLQDGGLSVADADGSTNSNGIETATLKVGEGALTATQGTSGAVVAGSGTNTVTITGTVAQIDALLQGTDGTSTLAYSDGSDTPSASTALTLSVNDGTLTSNTARTTIAIQAVDDAPTIAAPATYQATEKQALSLQGIGLTVADVDGGTGSETVTLAVGEGTLTATQGTTGVNVTGQNTGTLTLNGTVAQLDTLLHGTSGTLTYTDPLDAPSASTTLTLTVSDNGSTGSGGPLSAQTTFTIAVTGVDQAPTAAAPASGVYQAVEQTPLSLKNAGLSIADPDGTGSAETATLSVGEGTLAATAGDSGATVASGSGTNTLTVTGTVTQVDAFLNGTGTSTLTYADGSDTPSASTTLTLAVKDGSNATGTAATTIAIQAVNDAPTATAGTATYAATEQTALNLKGTGLSVGDVDGGTGTETATLSVGEGTLTATTGDSGATVTGSGTTTLTVRGTTAQIDALLASGGSSTLSYTDGSDTPSASTALTLMIDDGGNTGTGGAKTAQAPATINVAAVNDAPTAIVPTTAYQATEQTPLNLKNTGLSVGDVDGGTGSETATLTVGEGTLSATKGDSGAAVAVSTDGHTVTITGTTAQIDAVLNGQGTSTLGYVDPLDAPSASTALTLSIDDNGNTGAGTSAPLTASASQTIYVAPVNDAPMATAPTQTYQAVEQTALDLRGTGLSVGDVDAGSGTVTATLAVGEGLVTAAAGTGASAGLQVANSGTGTLTLTGTVAQIDALLQGTDGTGTLSYVDPSDTPSASTQLTLSVDDNGNTGSGGALASQARSSITIQAVNDAPTATAATQTYQATEKTGLSLKNTGLSVADVDGGSGIETATLSVGEGILDAAAGDSGVAVTGSGTGSLSISGTTAQIDALLGAGGSSTLSYVDANNDPSGSTGLTLKVDDHGNTGVGGSLTASATATIDVGSHPDIVSLAPTITYDGRGIFTFTGFASSAAGVATVDFSAVIHGVMEDLGTATSNPDGSFSFDDHVGPRYQGQITATETDNLGQQTSVAFPSSIQGGLRGNSFAGQNYVARLDDYDASGDTNTAQTYFNQDGSDTVSVLASNTTLYSNAFDTFLNHGRGDTKFVFTPGYGQDTISGFRLSGPDHDTLELPSSDFTSLADVLRHTQDTSAGAVIHDPTSGDTLTIAGISKEQLVKSKSDFTLHG